MRWPIDRGAAALLLGLGLAGCGRATPSPVADEGGPRTVASLQELMLNVVDPSADALWDSVSAVYSKAGDVIKEPKTDADWAALRSQALLLAEAPNLLALKGRLVTVKGGKVADEGEPGIRTAAQIQKMIDDDPARFATGARGLQDAALKMIEAIDRRDVAAVELVGSEIDEACEVCHTQYWYPPESGSK